MTGSGSVVYGLFGLFIVVCYIWTSVLAFRLSTGWGLVATFVPCGQLAFTIQHWQRAKIPFLLRVPVFGALFAYGFVTGYRNAGARAAAARLPAESAIEVRTDDARVAVPQVEQKAPAPLPAMGGVPVDLSTIMGRARALADAWQRDAALLEIEATHVSDGLVQTEQGGLARLTFGPSPFADPGRRGGSFLVTYDDKGLHSEALPTKTAPLKSLVEPMCAPEEAYRRASAGSSAAVTLRYTFNARLDRAVWLASNLSSPKTPGKAFDGQTCALLAP